MAMRKAFISCAREDYVAAQMIADRVRKAGVSVFVDDAASLVAGGTWSTLLGTELLESSAVVVILSTNARKTNWVASEVQAALESKKVVVPVLLDDRAKENWLWPLLANRQSFVLHLNGLEVDKQLDSIVTAIDEDARGSRAPSWRWTAAFVGIVILILAFAGIFWQRTAQTAQFERDRRIAAETERARVEKELQDKLNHQADAERLVVEGAQLASQRGRLSDAIALYNRGLQLNPDNAVAHQLLGYAYLRRAQLRRGSESTDLENAIRSLERAVALDPQYIWASYNLALAYWEAGRPQDAIAAVRRVLEIDPSFRSVITNDGQFARFRKSQDFRTLLQDH
jgi:tetratricopeptide (TPR) repeat protein